MARVIVCGDRNFDDEKYVWDMLDDQDGRQATGLMVVIDGAASGADSMGHAWARYRGRTTERYRPHWRHDFDCEAGCKRPVGKVAGVLRNQQMLDEGKPDLVIAFHRDIDASRGTRDMIRRSVKAGIQTILFDGGPHGRYMNEV